MAGIKIVDLPPLGRDLASTDLLELSLAGGTGSRKITGQEIMNTSKLNIGTTAITSGTVGRVLFEGTGNVVQESANLFWDNTNVRLGIGTSSPTVPIHGLVNNQNIVARFEATGTGEGNIEMSGVAPQLRATTTNGASGFRVSIFGSTTGDVFRLQDSTTTLINVKKTGNVLINTTTDAGFRLDVNGTARVQGDVDITTTQGGNKLSLNHGTTGSYAKVAGISFGANSTSLSVSNNGGTTTFIGGAGIYSNNTASGGNLTDLIFWTTSGGAPSARMRITNDGNLGINTTTIGSRLQINGNTAIGFSASTAAPTNGLAVSGGSSLGTFLSMDGTGVASPPTGGSYGLFPYSGVGLGINSLVGIGIFANGSERMRIFSTGNIGINTTTDAGFRLDVNGTARVSGLLTLSSNLQFFQSGQYSQYLSVTSNNYYFGSATGLQSGGQIFARTINTDRIVSGATGNQYAELVIIGGTYNSNSSSISFQTWDGGSQSNRFIINSRNNSGVGGDIIANPNNGTFLIGTTTAVASSKLTVDSTTQGFLPPRMTQTQRNAIASPAIGLEIYQTDATEGKYIYKSSGWTYIG